MPNHRRPRSACASLGLAAVLLSAPAAAEVIDVNAEVAALRAEMASLQARLAALEARTAPADVPVPPTPPTPPMSNDAAPTIVAAGPGLRVEDRADASSFRIAGRIHWDAYAFDRDLEPATGGTEFRRARVQADGKAGDWAYRLQLELAGGSVDLRDVYLAREWGQQTLTLGQFKPYRSMDELTSSNSVSVMERGFGSASGLFADRAWQQGIGLTREARAGTLGVSVFSLREDNSRRNEGWGASARGTWAPIDGAGRTLHLGAWASVEEGGLNTPATAVELAYGGRRGPEALLFASVGGDGFAQRSAGLELAGRAGSFHWQSEWSRATIAGLGGDGEVQMAYLQAGWVFGGARRYVLGDGVFGGPENVGAGLWEAVARIDEASRTDASDTRVRRVVLGLNRYATDDLRFMLNWTLGQDAATGDDPRQWALRAQYVF